MSGCLLSSDIAWTAPQTAPPPTAAALAVLPPRHSGQKNLGYVVGGWWAVGEDCRWMGKGARAFLQEAPDLNLLMVMVLAPGKVGRDNTIHTR